MVMAEWARHLKDVCRTEEKLGQPSFVGNLKHGVGD